MDEEMKKVQEDKREALKVEHEKKLEEIREAIAKRQEEREKARHDWKSARESIKADNYVYAQLEQQYQKQIILPQLEE